jgi:hypothetical protein
MQPAKLSKILMPCALAMSIASTTAIADTGNYAAGFTTVPEITVTQDQAMNFGTGMLGGTGLTCIMEVGTASTTAAVGTAYAGSVIMKLRQASTLAQGTDYGDITGTGCSGTANATGTPGIYRITGVPAGEVNVAPQQIVGTSFQFDPVGCVGNYDSGTDGDSCDLVDGTGSVPVNIADSDDTIGGTGGLPTSGVTLLALGGTITQIDTFLTATTYTESFTINVTY